ncbi:hypothetical protein CISIN_1g0476082mg, partial [Citrus sinensis]
MVRRPSGE